MAKKSRAAFTYEYPRPALTADIVLVSKGVKPKVLLIERAKDPFAGCWALPGGFAEPGETLLETAQRELEEETGLKVEGLEQLIAMGDPGRDPRGWTVSVVFYARVTLSKLKAVAADDAAKAKWFPLDALPKLAFDHAEILKLLASGPA